MEQGGGVVWDVPVQLTGRSLVVPSVGAGGELQRGGRRVLVGHLGEQVRDAVEAGPPFVVGLDHVPGRLGNVGVDEHLIFRP